MAKDAPKCSCDTIHEDTVNDIKSKMPKDENLYDLAEFFKVFGDTTRIKIIYVLFFPILGNWQHWNRPEIKSELVFTQNRYFIQLII